MTNPPPYGVRTLAEWEELQAIMITWTSFPSILAQIVGYKQQECTVYIVCNDSNTVKSYLVQAGIIPIQIYPRTIQFNLDQRLRPLDRLHHLQ